jgi:hypothetical protein
VSGKIHDISRKEDPEGFLKLVVDPGNSVSARDKNDVVEYLG